MCDKDRIRYEDVKKGSEQFEATLRSYIADAEETFKEYKRNSQKAAETIPGTVETLQIKPNEIEQEIGMLEEITAEADRKFEEELEEKRYMIEKMMRERQ